MQEETVYSSLVARKMLSCVVLLLEKSIVYYGGMRVEVANNVFVL